MIVGPRTDRPLGLAVRPSLVLVLVSFAVATWLTVDLILDGPMSRFDEFVADRIGPWQVGDDNPLVYGICWTITQIGGQRALILIVMAVLVGYLCWTRRTLQPLARTLVALLLLTITVYAFKYGLGRTAPEFPGGSFLHRDGQSYPSGHTANAVLMWGIATWLAVYYGLPVRVQRLFATLFVVSPIASGVTMLLLNFHWVTDLLTGAAVGLILLWVIHVVFDGPLGRWTGIPEARADRIPTSSVSA
ncbi:MAG: phosphatase PAP2 family protein [Actinomycetota bacterium]|nr:phosphatase PAP2 family protein [Actinomycetota bacterium]